MTRSRWLWIAAALAAGALACGATLALASALRDDVQGGGTDAKPVVVIEDATVTVTAPSADTRLPSLRRSPERTKTPGASTTTPSTDAGTQSTDAGTQSTDAGTQSTDAGTPSTDAGTPSTPTPSATTPPSTDGSETTG